jgi:glycosyltransferase involved in cell wall biosynthesis
MNIGMVLAGRDFPPDIRVEKEIRALQEKEHRCFVICENPAHKPFRNEWEGSVIYRIPQPSLILRKANSLFYRLLFFNIQWFRYLLRIAKEESIDVFHVHDLPMCGTALWAGKYLRIPVIVDFHENYPAAVTYYKPAKRTIYQKMLGIFNGRSRWQRYEKRAANQADRVIVVVDEAKTRLSQLGIDHRKIFVIENTIDVQYFESLGKSEHIIERYRDDFLISYIGGYGGYHRGLDTAVKAMPKVIQEIPNVRLLLVGKGKIKPELQKLVENLKIENHVTFEDWRPFDEVPSYIEASQICLIPHQSNPHTEATSPHKLFQYMLMGKPVVVSSCKPLQRVVQETGGGLVFSAGDSDHLSEVILQLRDENLREKLGQAGKQAVLNRYNWEITSRDLIRLYEKL